MANKSWRSQFVAMFILLYFLFASRLLPASAEPKFPITASPPVPPHIFARQDTTNNVPSICGYGPDGKEWKAPPSFKCMVDTEAGYFGFCPLTISNAKDCGFARACIDSHTCTEGEDGGGGCGRMGGQPYGTATCTGEENGYCYTNLLLAPAPASASNNPSSSPETATYSFIACGNSYRQAAYVIATDVLPSPSRQTSNLLSSFTQQSPTLSSPTTTPTQTATTSDVPRLGSSPNTGAIIGGVLGGLTIMAITALLFYFLRKRYSSFRPLGTPHPSPSLPSAGGQPQNGLINHKIVEDSVKPAVLEADEKAVRYEMAIPPAELGGGVEVAELGVDDRAPDLGNKNADKYC
ncbi:hypothetical protein DM02DRAFT_730815 [Periconia macrospinosa]|uniref:Mid2 domain-containing protein n=1 Tax=Periconia macrospinosa TaxID=97972 RepID=A0A2V1DIG8_9PLEO|nr:hypothetical protein DM02DRAFT_730815 [Periconia macrospinosa]